MKRGRRPHPDILTPREWEVLGLIREGLSNEQIAERLEISVHGAKYHVSEILSKLGVRDRLEAARWRPDEEHAWWAVALAPLALWRRPIVAKLLVSALAVTLAAGGGLLVWGLLVTRGSSSGGELAANRTPFLFDTTTGRTRVLSGHHNIAFAKWLKDGETFMALDSETRAWEVFDLHGNELRTLATLPQETAPYVTIHLELSPDGTTAIELRDSPPSALGSTLLGVTILDLTSGSEGPFRGPAGQNGNELFSPDGQRLTYTNQNADRNSLMLANLDGSDGAVLRSAASPNYSIPVQWSADGSTLLIESYQPGSSAPSFAASYEVIDLSGTTVWHMDFGRLTYVQWAGPGRLLVQQPEVTAVDGSTLQAAVRYVSVSGSAESTVAGPLADASIVVISPDGLYAVAVRGASDSNQVSHEFDVRCSLIELGTGTERASEDNLDAGYCGTVDWTSDSRLALVSGGGN